MLSAPFLVLELLTESGNLRLCKADPAIRDNGRRQREGTEMNAFWLFLHFVGLMLGAAGGFGSAIVMRRALTLPDDQAKVLRGLGPTLANVMGVGVALLWVTGLIMVFSIFGGFANLPKLFLVKLIFILTLTAAVGMIHMTYAQIRKGNTAAAARLPIIGPIGGISALLAVLFAVYTFG